MAASTNPILRTMIPIITQKYLSIDLEWLLKILCMAAHNFFHQEVSERRLSLEIYHYFLFILEFSSGPEENIFRQI